MGGFVVMFIILVIISYVITFRKLIKALAVGEKYHGVIFIIFMIPIINAFIIDNEMISREYKRKERKVNEIKKCPHCNISSAYWQVLIEGETYRERAKCNKCNECHSWSYRWNEVNPDIKYPFARKLKGIHLTMYLMKEQKKVIKEQKIKKEKDDKLEEIAKLNKKMKEIELYNDELVAFENILKEQIKEMS